MQLRAAFAPFLFAVLLCAPLRAQEPPSARIKSLFTKSPTDRLVDQLVENAATFRATLPSLTAHETIESDSSFGWVFRSHAKAEATMRVMRKTPAGPLDESREITILNGKPVAPGKHVDLPSSLSGGFGRLPGFFFNSSNRHCFNYSLIPKEVPDGTLELDITLSPDAASSNCPKGRVSGVALVSSETHQLTHVEWSLPNEDALSNALHQWPFASVDLAPTEIGDKTFWLPTTVIGRSINGKERADWVSHYSDYHRFAATATILPDTP